MTTHLYIRVSTSKQDDSVDLQRAVLTRYCEHRSLLTKQPQWWEDHAVSARLVAFADRPAGGALEAQLKAGDTIVAKCLDRLFRNVADGITTVERWREAGIAVRLADQDGVSLDSSTATGWLVLVQLLTIGQFEALLTAERTTKCMAERRRTGRATSHPPFGYHAENQGTEARPDRVLVRDEREQAILARLVELRETGETYRQAADILNNEGHRTRRGSEWNYSMLAKVVRNQGKVTT